MWKLRRVPIVLVKVGYFGGKPVAYRFLRKVMNLYGTDVGASMCVSLMSDISHFEGSMGGKNVSASGGSGPSMRVMARRSANSSVSA